MRRLSQSERIGAVRATLVVAPPTAAVCDEHPIATVGTVASTPNLQDRSAPCATLMAPYGLMHITDGQNERVRVAQSHLIVIVSCCEDTYPCNGPTSVSCSAPAVMARRAPLLS